MKLNNNIHHKQTECFNGGGMHFDGMAWWHRGFL